VPQATHGEPQRLRECDRAPRRHLGRGQLDRARVGRNLNTPVDGMIRPTSKIYAQAAPCRRH